MLIGARLHFYGWMAGGDRPLAALRAQVARFSEVIVRIWQASRKGGLSGVLATAGQRRFPPARQAARRARLKFRSVP